MIDGVSLVWLLIFGAVFIGWIANKRGGNSQKGQSHINQPAPPSPSHQVESPSRKSARESQLAEYQPVPSPIFRLAGRFVGQTVRLATKSGFNFTISVLAVMLYFLFGWAALYRAEWFRDFPYPPEIAVPFLGHPNDWSLDQSVVGLIVMTVIWVGAVKINVRNTSL